MRNPFAEQLMKGVEKAVKKKVLEMQKQVKAEAAAMTLGGSVEKTDTPVLPQTAPPTAPKGASSVNELFGGRGLTRSSRTSSGQSSRGGPPVNSSMATFQGMTAPPRTSNLTQDVMLDQGEDQKGMVFGRKKREGVWEESLRKKQVMKQRLISRARRKMNS